MAPPAPPPVTAGPVALCNKKNIGIPSVLGNGLIGEGRLNTLSDNIFVGQNYSSDIIFVTSRKIRHFCPTKFFPI